MEELRRERERRQAALEERRLMVRQTRKKASPIPPFPRPPFPGNTCIIPITTKTELFKEGDRQRHCIFAYSAEIAFGLRYVYKVLHPERAILMIMRSSTFSQAWGLADVRGKSNGVVSPATIATVNAWLREAGIKPSP